MTTINRNQNTSRVNRNIEETVLFNNTASHEREVKMGLADDGLDILLDLLSDPSSDCGGYVLREAYSNAYDAVMESGNPDAKIEITLPKDPDQNLNLAHELGYVAVFENELVVSDEGCGMTPEQVEKYFIQYGGSTKRDNADAIGSKGLGALAPLSVSDFIKLETVRDGIETRATIERRSGGNYATITTAETDKANGTVVSVPVKDANVIAQMKRCAESISRHSTNVNLYIDGEQASRTIDGYAAAGTIEIGVDDNGNPNLFNIWIKNANFPLAYNDWGLVLGGYRYSNNSYYDSPVVLLEGEPGYLNFNLSRDEIKRDAAFKAFNEAVAKAIEKFSCPSELVDRFVEELTFNELVSWVVNKGYWVEDGKVLMGNSRNTPMEAPRAIYSKGDGSMMDLFMGGGRSFEAVQFNFGSCAGSAYLYFEHGVDGRCHYQCNGRGYMSKKAFDPKVKLDTFFNARDFSYGHRHKYILVTSCGADAMNEVFSRILSWTKAHGVIGCDYTIAMTADVDPELTDMERFVFADPDLIVTQSQFVDQAKEYDRSRRSNGRKTAKTSGVVHVDFNHEISSLTSFNNMGFQNWRDYVTYDDVKGKCALVVGNIQNCGVIDSLFGIAVANGLTDKRYLVKFSSTKPANVVIEQMKANGDEVFFDCRRGVKNLNEGLLEKFAYIEKEDKKNFGFSISATLVSSKLDAKWLRANRPSFERTQMIQALPMRHGHFEWACDFLVEEDTAADADRQAIIDVKSAYDKTVDVEDNLMYFAGAIALGGEEGRDVRRVRKLAQIIYEYGVADPHTNDNLKVLARPLIVKKIAEELCAI